MAVPSAAAAVIMLLMERGYEVPGASVKKAFLIDKKAAPERMQMVIAKAKEERRKGVQVNISMMKKNKKFQKEQLAAEGYEDIEEYFA